MGKFCYCPMKCHIRLEKRLIIVTPGGFLHLSIAQVEFFRRAPASALLSRLLGSKTFDVRPQRVKSMLSDQD